jgi:hypothetical protein
MNEELLNSTLSAAVPPASGVQEEKPKKRRRSSSNYLSYEEAQLYAQTLGVQSRKEWREYVKGLRVEFAAKPETIPSHPDGIYKTKGWQGWRQWLGTDKPKDLN